MSALHENPRIEFRDGLCGPVPFIAGHRVHVEDVVIWAQDGRTPEQIADLIPSISLADVYAALAYYYDNREVLERQIETEEEALLRSSSGIPHEAP